ncbi:heterokaryon incompatibility protein-domain-containing protein, partial [Truncatella angustata]
WIEICKKRHRTLCTSRRNDIPSLKVIDCSSTRSQLAIVPAPPNEAYLALSYVWGESRKRKRDDGRGRVSKSPSNQNYQTVVRDAEVVVLQLGYRYLWVEKFCIDQENESEKELFVNSMDKIYSGAELNIVAAAGIDGNFGLPGVVSRQRKMHPTVQLRNAQLVSCLEHPRSSIMASKWATRAWTHQEALLSQRLLFFTEFETYYEYHSMQCHE